MSNEHESLRLSPPKTIQTFLKATFEETIALIYSQIITYQNEKHTNICLSITPSTFKILNYILTKQTRSNEEILIIKTYLNSIPKFISFLNIKNPEQILFSLASVLKSEKYPQFYPVIKYGTHGDLFYIILKGKVSVLVPKDSYYQISPVNYIKHLLMLKLLNEDEIYYKTLAFNYSIGIEINDNIINTIIDGIRYKDYLSIEIYGLNIEEINSIIDFGDYAIELVDSLPTYKNNIKLLAPEMYIKLTSPEFPVLCVNDYIHKNKSHKNRHNVKHITLFNVHDNKVVSNNNNTEEEKTKGFQEIKLLLSSYIQVVTQSQGDSFGELALINKINKRTATIICKDECLFGILSRENFNAIIKDHQWKKRKNNVNFLLSFAIFKGMNWNYFESKIFNFFKFKIIYQGSPLIKEGENFEKIYFIKEGLFELNISLSLNEIANIIHSKQNQLHLKPIEDAPKTKLNFKLSIANNRDIIGFNDITYNNLYFANIICISANAKVYSIDYEILSKLSDKLPNFCEHINTYVQKRQDVLINRLINLYNYHYVKYKSLEMKADEKISMNCLFMSNHKHKSKTNIMKYNQTQQYKAPTLKFIKKKINLIGTHRQNKLILNSSDEHYNNNIPTKSKGFNSNKSVPQKKYISFHTQPHSSRPNTSMNDTLRSILGRKYRQHPTSKAFELFSKTLRDHNNDNVNNNNSGFYRNNHKTNKEAVVDLLYYDKNVIQDNPNFSQYNLNYHYTSRNKKELSYIYPMLSSNYRTITDSNDNENILRRIKKGKNARINRKYDVNTMSNLISFRSDDCSIVTHK
jgi:CRP-like cAMP-binding protein